jgi:hypothetical protein
LQSSDEEVDMMNLCHRIALTVALSAGALLSASSARAESCKAIRAEIDLTNGTISGNFGLKGTVVFTADSSGTPPATAPAGSSVFSGILEITTPRGVLRMRETGMFSSRTGNPAGPVMASWGDAMSGTGAYQGASGDVFFNGRRVDAVFLVEVTGEICRP